MIDLMIQQIDTVLLPTQPPLPEPEVRSPPADVPTLTVPWMPPA